MQAPDEQQPGRLGEVEQLPGTGQYLANLSLPPSQ